MLIDSLLPRAAAAALALAASLVAAPSASAAVTTQHYQAMAQMVCNGGCQVKWPQLASNRTLQIDHISCEVIADDVQLATLQLLPASLSLNYPLPLQWERSTTGGQSYTFGGDLNLRVPLGKQLSVTFFVVAPVGGYCTASGTLYTAT